MTFPFAGQEAPPFDAGLLRTYRASEYVCRNYRLRPGIVNGRWAEYLAENGHGSFTFVTAYNPYSDATTPPHVNLARAQVLRNWVREQGYAWLPAAGVDPSGDWPVEVGVMVFDLPLGRALEVGAGFGQHAICYGGVEGVLEVLWCRCGL